MLPPVIETSTAWDLYCPVRLIQHGLEFPIGPFKLQYPIYRNRQKTIVPQSRPMSTFCLLVSTLVYFVREFFDRQGEVDP